MYSSNQTNIIILFECGDIRRDTSLLLLKRKEDDKFEIHLNNGYTNQAIAMVLSVNDFAKMFEAMEQYFQMEQITES
jgi:hypothetical protein